MIFAFSFTNNHCIPYKKTKQWMVSMSGDGGHDDDGGLVECGVWGLELGAA